MSPLVDDHVIVERRRMQDGIMERTCKRLARVENRFVLVGDSTDERWNLPMDLSASPGGDETVEIVGLVIGMYRPRRR